VAINFLELFVAFLQAFIFTFLSAMFIGQAVNLHLEESHAAEAHSDRHRPAEARAVPGPAAGITAEHAVGEHGARQ